MDDRTVFWLNTFEVLSPSRPMTEMGPRFIPLSEIKAYLDMVVTPAANDEFIIVVRAMDEVYLDEWARKQKQRAMARGKK